MTRGPTNSPVTGQGPRLPVSDPPSLGQDPREEAKDGRVGVGKPEAVGPVRGRQRGAGSGLGLGCLKMEATGRKWRPGVGGKESSRARKGPSRPGGQVPSPRLCFHSPRPPRTQVPPSATAPTARPPGSGVGPPQKATFQLRHASPPPPKACPQPSLLSSI